MRELSQLIANNDNSSALAEGRTAEGRDTSVSGQHMAGCTAVVVRSTAVLAGDTTAVGVVDTVAAHSTEDTEVYRRRTVECTVAAVDATAVLVGNATLVQPLMSLGKDLCRRGTVFSRQDSFIRTLKNH